MKKINDYIYSLTWLFFDNKKSIFPTLSFESLQVIVNKEFEKFWSKPENRKNNERNGKYFKIMYYLDGRKKLAVHRETLNKFKSSVLTHYLKYSDEVILSILDFLSSTKIKFLTLTRLASFLNEHGFDVKREFVRHVRDNWKKVGSEIETSKVLPTHIHDMWIETSMINRTERVENEWSPEKQAYFCAKKGSKNSIYTNDKYSYIAKDVEIVRAYGKVKDTTTVFLLNYKIGDTSSKNFYNALFKGIKNKDVHKIANFTCDSPKILEAFENVFNKNNDNLE